MQLLKGGLPLENLRRLREEKQYSQQKIASKLKISQQAYAKWETGESMPRAEKLPQLAKILGCSVDDLFKPA